MPKKNRAQYDEDLLKTRMFKWEFLRRNKDYILGYKKALAIKNAQQRIKDKIKLGKKYGINVLIDPGFSFLNRRHFSSLSKPTTDIKKLQIIFKELQLLHELFECQAPVVCFQTFDEKEKALWLNTSLMQAKSKESNTILVSINLDTPNEILMNYLEDLIKNAQSKFQEIMGQGPLRPRLQEYVDYLNLYDLRESGKTYKQIAKIVFSSQEPSAEDRIRKNLKAAKRLIDGDYRRIR